MHKKLSTSIGGDWHWTKVIDGQETTGYISIWRIYLHENAVTLNSSVVPCAEGERSNGKDADVGCGCRGIKEAYITGSRARSWSSELIR